MGSHVAAMFKEDEVRACFDAITVNPARMMHLEGYGLEPGCHADMVVLQAADPLEAIRHDLRQDLPDELIGRFDVFLTDPPYTLEGHIGRMKCPYLIVHGGYDVLGVAQARKVHEAAQAAGVDVTLRLVDQEETGADHCQHDNPTIGQEILADWLAEVFEIDERELMSKTLAPIL